MSVKCVATSEDQTVLEAARVAIRGAPTEVRVTTAPGELRAAAAARALSFYTYPPGRSAFSVRAHRNMRIDAEWDTIGAKITGTDLAFKDCRVACIVAALPLGPNGELPEGMEVTAVDASCMVPARGGSDKGCIILGTLDVNQGVSLPAEELAGMLPRADDPVPPGTDCSEDGKGTNDGCADGGTGTGDEGGLAGRPMRYRRAYLSNVCVLPAARRTGLGRRLMAEAMKVAAGWGVERMYVHVVHDNVGAKAFYEDFGFEVEAEESAAYAAGLSRPPRLLLTQPCASTGPA